MAAKMTKVKADMTGRYSPLTDTSWMETNGLKALPSGPIIRKVRPKYGLRYHEYHAIALRVLGEDRISETIAALQQRLGMLWLMLNDCQDMIDRRKNCERRKVELTYERRILKMWAGLLGLILGVTLIIFLL